MQYFSEKPNSFFITGTGRCGTMLLSRLFELSSSVICKHEEYFRHQSMLEYYNHDDTGFINDIDNSFEPDRSRYEKKGITLGVSSGHIYFALPQLWKKYDKRARYIFLVRRPEEFARSAIARGFFDPNHPNYCNQIVPHKHDPISNSWLDISVLERNLWYWTLVNRFILNMSDRLPHDSYRIVRIEEFNLDLAIELCAFLGITDIDKNMIEKLLNRRINASPNQQSNIDVNPYSIVKSLPDITEWNKSDRDLLDKYTLEITNRIYPPTRNI